MRSVATDSAANAVCSIHLYRPYYPLATIKCSGKPLYRSRRARDYACLIDLDPEVVSWRSVTSPVVNDAAFAERAEHNVDFWVQTVDRSLLVDVWLSDPNPPDWISGAAARQGCDYQAVSIEEFAKSFRLQNAKDLMRYANWSAALGDRIRILASLEEAGTLSLAECLGVVREGRPMATVASLILRGFLEVELDETLLGPGTVIRRAAS